MQRVGETGAREVERELERGRGREQQRGTHEHIQSAAAATAPAIDQKQIVKTKANNHMKSNNITNTHKDKRKIIEIVTQNNNRSGFGR